MKKRLSIIILAAEISGIVFLHAFKPNHQTKTDKVFKSEMAPQEAKISPAYFSVSLR
jgi:hypothetical protein